MKNEMKRCTAALLALVFLLALLPAGAAAADTVASGSCGENLSWALDSDGVLTISGTGDMTDFVQFLPWYDYCGSIKKVVILDGVTSIGKGAFSCCSRLASVTIPDSVTSIGDRAFEICEYLTSVTIPEGVTSIGNYTFFECGLTGVTIPEGVTSIGSHAFCECWGLRSVTIPSSVTSIGDRAFFSCGNLMSISVASDNPNYSSEGGVLFNKDKTALIYYPACKQGAYTIPEGVTSIGDLAFGGCRGLTSVTIPSSVTSIGDYAFHECGGITGEIVIPEGVTSIGNGAFSSCESLTSVTIPSSVTSIGDYAFEYCYGLKEVYYNGSEDELNALIGDYNYMLRYATRHFYCSPTAITTQTQNYTGRIGDAVSFTVGAAGDGLTYQWQYSSDGGTTWKASGLPGNKTAVLSTELTEARLVYLFRCVVTDAYGGWVTTNAVRMLKTAELVITAQPADYAGFIGDAVSFMVGATGDGLKYQWQYSKDGGSTWGNSGLPGNKTAVLSTELTEARLVYLFRCVVSDAYDDSVTTNAVRMIKRSELTITAQPTDYTGRIGDAVSFTVGAAGDVLEYQWQYSKNGGATWENSGLPGNKTAVLSTELTEARLIYLFRCVVTDAYGGSAATNAVRMMKEMTELAITAQPADYTGKIGDAVSFTVGAAGDGLSYQWQYSSDGGITWKASGLPGNKTATLTTELTEARLVYLFRCAVTDSNGNSMTTNAVRMIKEKSELVITAQPSDYTGRFGDAVNFTVGAAGDGLSYQWQYSSDGGNIWKVSGLPGNKTAVLTTDLTEARLVYLFRCVLTDTYGGSVATNAVRMIKRGELAITALPGDFTGGIGSAVSFTVGATGDGLKYQWQYSKDGGATWGNSGLPGNRTAVLTTELTEARLVYLFRCVVTDEYGGSVTTNAVRMIKRTELAITVRPEDYAGVIGDAVSFTVTATGDGLTYQWQYSSDGGATWGNSGLPGNRTAVLSTEFTEARLRYLFRCVITDNKGGSVTTNAVRMIKAAEFAITAQPEDYVGRIGDAVSFTVTATGDGLTYQWQYSSDGGATWGNSGLPGNKTAVLSTELTEARLVYLFRCVVTDGRGRSTVSDPVRIILSVFNVTCDAGEGHFPAGEDEPALSRITAEVPEGVLRTGDSQYLPLPERDGYEFVGWTIGGKFVSRIYLNADITLEAEWEKRCALTFDAAGGGWSGVYGIQPDTYAVSAREIYVSPGAQSVNGRVPDPVREGYAFRGWTYGGKAVSRVNVEDSVTLTAKWVRAFTVTFDAGGGMFADGGAVRTECLDGGSAVCLDGFEIPYLDGFRFAGWADEEGSLLSRLTVTENVTLSAEWEKLTYITYDANGGAFADGRTVLTDEALPGIYRLGASESGTEMIPSRRGFEFVGWTDGDGDVIDRVRITADSQDMTVYAAWEGSEEPAEEPAEIISSGSCGEDLSWTLDSDGVLTISGTGKMANYNNIYASPWCDRRRDFIKTVVISEGVTSIGDVAFRNCSGLTSVTIPASVTSIGVFAFDRCSGLTGVTIPESVTSIGGAAFSDCTGLTDISVASGNPNYCSESGVLFNKNKTALICYPAGKRGAYTIPAGVTSIGDDAFEWCTGLTSVTIPEGVTSICSFAFYNCSGLTGVTIPESVTSIYYSAFSGCGSLTDVYYGGSEAQWDAITKGGSNDCLLNAEIHYDRITQPGAADSYFLLTRTYESNGLYYAEGVNFDGCVVYYKLQDEAAKNAVDEINSTIGGFDYSGSLNGVSHTITPNQTEPARVYPRYCYSWAPANNETTNRRAVCRAESVSGADFFAIRAYDEGFGTAPGGVVSTYISTGVARGAWGQQLTASNYVITAETQFFTVGYDGTTHAAVSERTDGVANHPISWVAETEPDGNGKYAILTVYFNDDSIA